MCVLVAQSCWTLCNPMVCNLPGSSVHGILQASILEWVAILFSKGSSWPRDWTWVFCIASSFFTVWPAREAQDFVCVLSIELPIFLTYLLSLHYLDFLGQNSQIDLKCWSLKYSGNADQGLPWWLRWWRICLQCGRPGFNSWIRKIPLRKVWLPIAVFLPGEFHGQRSLVGYQP